MKFLLSVAVSAFISLGSFVTPASADTTLSACMEDMKKFCAEVSVKDATKCLTRNSLKLSSTCRRALGDQNNPMNDIERTCKNDIASHCAEVKPGQGRVIACLRSKQSNLSKSCAKTLTSMLTPSS